MYHNTQQPLKEHNMLVWSGGTGGSGLHEGGGECVRSVWKVHWKCVGSVPGVCGKCMSGLSQSMVSALSCLGWSNLSAPRKHQAGIEPWSHRWQQCILPPDHCCRCNDTVKTPLCEPPGSLLDSLSGPPGARAAVVSLGPPSAEPGSSLHGQGPGQLGRTWPQSRTACPDRLLSSIRPAFRTRTAC